MRWGLALAIVLSSTPAFADATQCSKDAEDGQRLKAAGRLRDAREKFLACSAPECPQIVQRDCATWAPEVLGMMPSIVIDAKDANGGDIGDVVTFVDGKSVATKIDGKAIPIDPGPHKLRFERRGYEPVTQDIIAKEGVRSRVVAVTFTRLAGIDDGPKGTAPPPSPPPQDTPSGGASKILPIVVMATGAVVAIVGVVLIATTPKLPPGCVKAGEKLPTGETAKGDTCGNLSSDKIQDDPKTAQNENPELAERQKEAGRVKEQPVLGVVTTVAGGVIIAGGLVWYLLLPSDKASATRPKVTPWVARESGGIMLGGTF